MVARRGFLRRTLAALAVLPIVPAVLRSSCGGEGPVWKPTPEDVARWSAPPGPLDGLRGHWLQVDGEHITAQHFLVALDADGYVLHQARCQDGRGVLAIPDHCQGVYLWPGKPAWRGDDGGAWFQDGDWHPVEEHPAVRRYQYNPSPPRAL